MTPLEQYRDRLQARVAEVARLQLLQERISTARLVLALLAATATWWGLRSSTFSAGWPTALVLIFVAVVIYHGSVRRRHTRVERAAAHYRAGIERIEDRWTGHGDDGERFNDPHHVYAADLDLFGRGNLFELLSTARTRMGEAMLASWLLAPAGRKEILERQQSVAELRDKLDLREELAVLGETAEVGVRPEHLLQWAEAPNELTARWILPVSLVLPLLAVAAIVLWRVSGLISPLLVILLVELGIVQLVRRRLRRIFASTEEAFDNLRLLAELPQRLEHEAFAAPLLLQLQGRLSSAGLRASHTIARLGTVVQFVESRRNPLLQVLDLPLLYSVQVALAAERWRRAHGHAVRSWLEVIGSFEALISLSAYSYEHPHDPFPDIVDGPAAFVATALGHPLLPQEQCVRNDVSITGETRVPLISGSNMSGKSTLLRSVGINTVLAMAGAPVRAERLQLTQLQVGANIRINDSLHEGSSRFYAEITRLRHLHELASRLPPLLFLLDEVLQGTNSKDRLIGAQGVIRALLARGAIGLVTTHDLALTQIDIGAAHALANWHFEDHLADGRMKFDFKLRPGVVTKSNGLELMRSIGLDV